MPQLSPKKRNSFKNGSWGSLKLDRVFISKSILAVLETNILFMSVGLRLCCILNISVIRRSKLLT